MIASFICRNPGYAIQNVRKLPSVRKAMLECRKLGYCIFCGLRNWLQAHHVIPVSVRPDLAADPANLRCLCRYCHQALGHLNNFKRYNPQLDAMVALAGTATAEDAR